MPSVSRTSLMLGVLVLLTAGSPSAQAADKCTGRRLKAVGKEVKGFLGCSAREITQDPEAAQICNIKVHDKFTTGYAKPQGCITPPASICEGIALDCQMKLRDALSESSTCEAARLRAAGKAAAAKIGCYAKAVTKGVSVDPACLTRAEDKFSAAFNNSAPCEGMVVSEVQALIEGCVFRVADEVDSPGGQICTSACSEAVTIDPCGVTALGTTSGHSTLEGTCAPETQFSPPENVYQWIPSASGVASIDTCGMQTNFDTVLYMRSLNCDSGGEVACDNDACGANGPSRIRPSVNAGTPYFIFVDGFNGAMGDFALTVAPPGTCGSPISIPASGGNFADTTGPGCTTPPVTGTCVASGTSPEKVYQWTPSASGMATIETCGGTTDFDTVLYIRTSCLDPNPPSEVGCNNDTCGLNGRASRITMMVTAGTPYFIFVDGVSGAAGHYTLTVTPPAGTCINPYIIPPEGGTFPGTTSGVSGQASTITCGGGGGGPEKVYQWTPSASGVAAIDTCDGTTPFQTNFITVLYIRSESPDCDTGVEVACDSGSCGVGGVGSQIMPTVNEGTSYFIFVDGFTGDDAGNYTLRVSPPSTITTTTTSTTTTTT